MRNQLWRSSALLLTILWTLPGAGLAAQERQPLDHDVYEIWATIGTRAISADGRWTLHTLTYEEAETELVLRAVDSGQEHRFARASAPGFTADGRRAVFRVGPTREARDEHREERRPQHEQPRDTLVIFELETGEATRIPHVRTQSLPGDAPEWMVYHLHPGDPGETEAERAENGRAENGALILRSLETGEEERFPAVTSFDLADDASILILQDRRLELEGTRGVRAVIPGTGDIATIFETEGTIRNLSLDADRGQVAILHEPAGNADGGDGDGDGGVGGVGGGAGDESGLEILHWQSANGELRTVATPQTQGIPAGSSISPFGGLSFSRSGDRIFFGTVPDASPHEPDPNWAHRLDSEVNVDVWHWQDSQLMTVQKNRMNQERRRNFEAVLLLDEGRVVQLADEEMASVSVGQNGDGSWAVGTDGRAYELMGSWESPNFRDVYLVEVATGERELIRPASQGTGSLSPGERFLTWYEPGDSTWYARELATGEVRDLGAMIPHPVYSETDDRTMAAGSYGSAGWLEDDARILIYDRFDLWAVDPSGVEEARAVTAGAGREQGVRYRLLGIGRDEPTLSPGQTVYLSAFNEWTKDAGFYRTALDASGPPQRLLMEPRNFSNPVKAADAERLLFTQETFEDFPDVWVSDMEFRDRVRVSEANPQQAEYLWGTTELVDWVSTDGHRLQGVLMKPENFDPNRQYPMVVYFYERWSDGLHDHYAPVPHRSRISFPMYTSHDYVVFIPDIVYRAGYPGESAMNSVVPGILKLLEAGFVDRERIALQGHSWGGYQIAFMVTRSQNLFRAAAAGAPVANMTSAYGGIRWQTGLVRQFQYERTQSRLGASLWDAPMRYIENSPLFWVDKIETPLLIMHNDNDGHVPWEQGIELFVAMRRLAKPAWLINYNDEPHWPTSFANRRDWNIRMKQFFDHFLKDEAPPVWLVDGIPAVRKGETLGYETVEGATAVDNGGR